MWMLWWSRSTARAKPLLLLRQTMTCRDFRFPLAKALDSSLTQDKNLSTLVSSLVVRPERDESVHHITGHLWRTYKHTVCFHLFNSLN